MTQANADILDHDLLCHLPLARIIVRISPSTCTPSERTEVELEKNLPTIGYNAMCALRSLFAGIRIVFHEAKAFSLCMSHVTRESRPVSACVCVCAYQWPCSRFIVFVRSWLLITSNAWHFSLMDFCLWRKDACAFSPLHVVVRGVESLFPFSTFQFCFRHSAVVWMVCVRQTIEWRAVRIRLDRFASGQQWNGSFSAVHMKRITTNGVGRSVGAFIADEFFPFVNSITCVLLEQSVWIARVYPSTRPKLKSIHTLIWRVDWFIYDAVDGRRVVIRAAGRWNILEQLSRGRHSLNLMAKLNGLGSEAAK